MARPASSTTPKGKVIRCTIELDEQTYDKYAESAIKGGKTAEDEIAQRLIRCKDHNAHQGLYFNDYERKELEKACGHGIVTPALAIQWIQDLLKLKVGDISIDIPTRLHSRLMSRKPRAYEFAKYLSKVIIEGLEREAGLRPW